MTKKPNKPTTFEFTHLLKMHEFIRTQSLTKSQYSYRRVVGTTDGPGWKWILTMRDASKESQSKKDEVI